MLRRRWQTIRSAGRRTEERVGTKVREGDLRDTHTVETAVIGARAAGLSVAVRLGGRDVLVVDGHGRIVAPALSRTPPFIRQTHSAAFRGVENLVPGSATLCLGPGWPARWWIAAPSTPISPRSWSITGVLGRWTADLLGYDNVGTVLAVQLPGSWWRRWSRTGGVHIGQSCARRTTRAGFWASFGADPVSACRAGARTALVESLDSDRYQRLLTRLAALARRRRPAYRTRGRVVWPVRRCAARTPG
jgi:hypothetical protein